MTLAWLYWNPSRIIFTIPIINWPILWYGFFFIVGFAFGYIILQKKFRGVLQSFGCQFPKQESTRLLDLFSWFIIGGTLIGARLGHIFFYDWPIYRDNPKEILKIWHGGLASHGAAIGILLGLYFFRRTIRKKYPEFTFLKILDILVIPTALAGFFIRLGNFFNQEILGVPSEALWAVIFGDPADGGLIVPRHPVQLYEGFAYLLIFFVLNYLWKYKSNAQGFISGMFFILLFGARFFIEFFKAPQSILLSESFIQMGQYLSLPFIVAGLFLIINSYLNLNTKAQRLKEHKENLFNK